MNKMMTSLVAFGAGMYALNMAQKNNMMSAKQMKKLSKRVQKMF